MNNRTMPPGMTAGQLQAIVCRLANGAWCRYWLHYSDYPWMMAIECRDHKGNVVEVPGLKEYADSNPLAPPDLYCIPRLDELGQPYEDIE